MGQVAQLQRLPKPQETNEIMPVSREEFQVIFEDAEALWSKISALADRELLELVEGAGHEILLDIAQGKQLRWDDIRPIAELLYHQGEVVGTLDVLRQPHVKREQPQGD